MSAGPIPHERRLSVGGDHTVIGRRQGDTQGRSGNACDRYPGSTRANGTGNKTTKKYHEAVLALYEDAGKEAARFGPEAVRVQPVEQARHVHVLRS